MSRCIKQQLLNATKYANPLFLIFLQQSIWKRWFAWYPCFVLFVIITQMAHNTGMLEYPCIAHSGKEVFAGRK